jgi:hypothetical protein
MLGGERPATEGTAGVPVDASRIPERAQRSGFRHFRVHGRKVGKKVGLSPPNGTVIAATGLEGETGTLGLGAMSPNPTTPSLKEDRCGKELEMIMGRISLVTLLTVLLAVLNPTISLTEEPETTFTEQIEVNLVDLKVVVTSFWGRPVTNLTRDDFEIWEDGERREISYFALVTDGAVDGAAELSASAASGAGGRCGRAVGLAGLGSNFVGHRPAGDSSRPIDHPGLRQRNRSPLFQTRRESGSRFRCPALR